MTGLHPKSNPGVGAPGQYQKQQAIGSATIRQKGKNSNPLSMTLTCPHSAPITKGPPLHLKRLVVRLACSVSHARAIAELSGFGPKGGAV